ncbi:MAG: sulfatase-like hydrolase/transferase, partial [Marinoscillum sp.]
NKPLFASIGTMSHHHDFRSYPKNRPLIYPNASTGDEHFSNSMFLADEYLKTFFHELKQRDYLKNSMVIIVGDHGFPSAGISIAVNGGFIYSGFSEELYRTPFLMLYDHLIPKRKKNAYAHTDIAPTILDFVGIRELVHFPGTSILSENEQHLFHLIQPFDGSYISSVIHPYKHVFHEQTGDEFIYNVERDPEETNDILEDIRAENPKMLERLQGGLKKAYIHQKLIDEDRIWPY